MIAMFSPFFCILYSGELDSYSEYWQTDTRPLFIFTNAATSYFLFSINKWRIPAICLMLLTAFSFDQYFWVHNITAICFFVASLISISLSKKNQYYVLPYLLSIIVLLESGILWGEICAITVICAFHLHRLIRYYRIDIKRKNYRL
jgi:hypothetical protein